MERKTRTDAQDFNALKKLGFELESPQDEYSYQPDSGGIANGEVGEIESGIEFDIDARGSSLVSAAEDLEVEDPEQPIPGESEWSQRNRLPEEELSENVIGADDREIVQAIQLALDSHPVLSRYAISVVVDDGVVLLRGEVTDDAIKALFRNVIEDVTGVLSVRDQLNLKQERSPMRPRESTQTQGKR